MTQSEPISEIIEAAVRWISADADNPDTPPQAWQAVIPLLKAAPHMAGTLEAIARLSLDGEDDLDLSNDDAVDTLHSCIELARDALGRAA